MKSNKKTKLKKEDDKDEQGWADIQDLFFSQQKKKWTTQKIMFNSTSKAELCVCINQILHFKLTQYYIKMKGISCAFCNS